VEHPSWWGEAFARLAGVTPARLTVVHWDGGDDATVEWVNASGAALFHRSPEELAGRRVSEVYAPYLDEVIAQFREARDHGLLRYEVVRELPEGRRTLDAMTIALGGDRYLAFALDRTEEREAQRRLDHVTRLTGAGVFHWNVARDESSWSDEMFRLLGHAPQAFAPAPERYLEQVHPDDRAEVERISTEARGAGAALEHSRHRIVRPDGEVRTVDARAELGYADGELVYVLGVARDVTEEVAHEHHVELLRRAEEQQRTALTVHDRVVQALATVVLALDLGDVDTARDEAVAATAAAQAVVTDLLREVADVQGRIEPGALRVVAPEAPR
jgi:PAS domain S-box-containing protein